MSSYTTAIDSITSCLAHAPKKCTQSRTFQFDINSPFQNTVYPKTKGTFPKYKLELTTGIHAFIDHAFVNIREFKMPRQLTATKKSHEKWIHIFSVSIVIIPTRLLCQMQANSSGAEFLSIISKFIKRNIILSLLVYVVVVQWQQRNVQKSVMHVQSCCFFFCLVKLLLFLLSRRHRILNLILFTIRCDPLIELLLLIASETFFDLSVVPSFLVRKA